VRVRQVIIGAVGAMLTGITALVAFGGLGIVPESVIGAVPDAVARLAAWAWMALGGLVLLYVVLCIVRRRPGAEPVARDPEVPIELDLSEPLEAGPRQSLPQLPAPYIAHPCLLADGFTGRFPERQELTDWARLKKSTPVRALVSVGGMGKSALAWVWLHRDVLNEDLPQAGQDPPDVRTACRVPAGNRPKGAMWWSFDQPGAGFSVFLEIASAVPCTIGNRLKT